MTRDEPAAGKYPTIRPRRLRYLPLVRELVRETNLMASNFILPLFVRHGRGISKDIPSMPGHSQLSIDRLGEVVGPALDFGIKSYILFGIPDEKDAVGSSAWDENSIVCQAIRELRNTFATKIIIITDECFCEYTDHGHCGVLTDHGG